MLENIASGRENRLHWMIHSATLCSSGVSLDFLEIENKVKFDNKIQSFLI